jgi:CheY-like chemotaxis protein
MAMTTARQVDAKPTPKVLLVDPDSESRGLYEEWLGPHACEIVHATDGREALVKVLEHPFSLVITETQLPLIDGYSLCELIRRDILTRRMPIMVVTADGRVAAQRRALSAGADAVLVKPCSSEVLASQAWQLMLKGFERGSRGAVPPVEPAPEAAPTNDAASGRTRGVKSRSHKRYDTTQPPVPPPALRCPSCDQSLVYSFSHVGGVSAREPEQWDYFTCPSLCGQFQYRQRTRKLQRA